MIAVSTALTYSSNNGLEKNGNGPKTTIKGVSEKKPRGSLSFQTPRKGKNRRPVDVTGLWQKEVRIRGFAAWGRRPERPPSPADRGVEGVKLTANHRAEDQRKSLPATCGTREGGGGGPEQRIKDTFTKGGWGSGAGEGQGNKMS